ncbi:glycine zipper 2TM domain-containing protein [Pseudomonas qingdaonensis]|uniref:glycine zipper 2TM domain-containing protein n=1 Tax=Pseudomonas qingdaonensis TaxID=2056231 RepID=UPI0033418E5D
MKVFLLALAVVLAGCVSAPKEPPLVLYGQVVSVQPHQVNEQKVNVTGALVGGVAGGVVGNQFGKGNGRKAMTVLGVVAGAAVGSHVGAGYEVKEVTDLEVRMADNSTIAVTTGNVGFAIGQRVKITQQGKQATIEVVR